MSEPMTPEMQAKMDACMKGGKSKEECTAMINEATPKGLDERLAAIEKLVSSLSKAHDEQAPFTAANRQERMAAAFDEALHKAEAEDLEKLKKWDEARAKAFDEKLAAYSAETDKSDTEILRRYLGVEKNQPLMMSDVPKMLEAFRKAQLETSPSGKRSEITAEQKAGPEGNKKTTNPIEETFDNFGVKA